jgi:hypothetical protein
MASAYRAPEPRRVPSQVLRAKGDRAAVAGSDRSGSRCQRSSHRRAHLISELGGEVPEEYYGGFLKVGQLGVLSADLAGALAPSAGLRNRLVHEYETIDDAKVLASVGVLLQLYPRYILAVESHLTKAGL